LHSTALRLRSALRGNIDGDAEQERHDHHVSRMHLFLLWRFRHLWRVSGWRARQRVPHHRFYARAPLTRKKIKPTTTIAMKMPTPTPALKMPVIAAQAGKVATTATISNNRPTL